MNTNKVISKKTKVNRGWRDKLFYGICGTILTLALLIVLFPIMNIVSSAFSDPKAVTAGKVWLFPVDFSLESFKNVLKFDKVWIGYKNTILYAGWNRHERDYHAILRLSLGTEAVYWQKIYE